MDPLISISDIFYFIFIKGACSRLEEHVSMSVDVPDDNDDDDDAQDCVPSVLPAASQSHEKCDQGTQRPAVPEVAYRKQGERGQREMRAELITTIRQMYILKSLTCPNLSVML